MFGGSTLAELCPYIEALSPEDHEVKIKLGVAAGAVSRLTDRVYKTALGQLFGIVLPGMVLAEHAFLGLRRPMYFAGDMSADKAVVVYSWRPALDFEWRGNLEHGCLEPRVPAADNVFTVLVRIGPIGDLQGSIHHWTWVREAPELKGAPVEWKERYEKPLWSRT